MNFVDGGLKRRCWNYHNYIKGTIKIMRIRVNFLTIRVDSGLNNSFVFFMNNNKVYVFRGDINILDSLRLRSPQCEGIVSTFVAWQLLVLPVV